MVWIGFDSEYDTDQVVEVLRVAGSNGITCAVRISECIEERVQRTLHQLNERLLDGVLPATTEHAVLKNVWDT